MKLGQWIGILALTLGLYILWQIRSVLMLIFAAVVLATALNTLAEQLQQRFKIKRSLSLISAVFGLLTILAIALWLVVPPFIQQSQELTQLLPKGLARIDQWVKDLSNLAPPFIDPYLPTVEDLGQQLQPLANRLLGSSLAMVSGTLGGLLNVLLVIILTLMFLFEPEPYRRAFVRCFPSFYRRRVHAILDKCGRSLQGWLLGILFNMLVIGGFSGIGLLLLGVQLPLANGVFAGLLTFIPNIGPALSVVPPMLIALLDAPWKALAVFGLYFFVQQLETNVLTPIVMAQQVAMLPAVTLLSQVFFATFFGFLGLLLALPLTVVGQVWFQEVVVKDILDRWHDPHNSPNLAMAQTDSLASSTSASSTSDTIAPITTESVIVAEPPTQSTPISPDESPEPPNY
jgi:predicted PurR-regulated permease PerM